MDMRPNSPPKNNENPLLRLENRMENNVNKDMVHQHANALADLVSFMYQRSWDEPIKKETNGPMEPKLAGSSFVSNANNFVPSSFIGDSASMIQPLSMFRFDPNPNHQQPFSTQNPNWKPSDGILNHNLNLSHNPTLPQYQNIIMGQPPSLSLLNELAQASSAASQILPTLPFVPNLTKNGILRNPIDQSLLQQLLHQQMINYQQLREASLRSQQEAYLRNREAVNSMDDTQRLKGFFAVAPSELELLQQLKMSSPNQSFLLPESGQRFHLLEQPNETQRKSYKNENRCILPNPLIICQRHPSTDQPMIVGGNVTVKLVDKDGNAFSNPAKANALESIDSGLTHSLNADHATYFSLKVMHTSDGQPFRLLFTVSYRVKGIGNVEERILTRPFAVYSNKHNRGRKRSKSDSGTSPIPSEKRKKKNDGSSSNVDTPSPPMSTETMSENTSIPTESQSSPQTSSTESSPVSKPVAQSTNNQVTPVIHSPPSPGKGQDRSPIQNINKDSLEAVPASNSSVPSSSSSSSSNENENASANSNSPTCEQPKNSLKTGNLTVSVPIDNHL